ncbi:MAG TPA: hypothetical protein VGY90_01160, partial [Steroidobacteraceae bacterium]|nr:hypothetical protein [Steroidobacteraceae bacterium]
APALGAGGLEFKSPRPDQTLPEQQFTQAGFCPLLHPVFCSGHIPVFPDRAPGIAKAFFIRISIL